VSINVTPDSYSVTGSSINLQRDSVLNIDGGYDEDYYEDYIADNHYGIVGAPIQLSYEPGSRLKYWNGSEWVAKPLKYWNGTQWVNQQLQYWNGSSWT
jgi:hypothetical protein